MTELPVPRKRIIARLQRVEGQLRGIQKMVQQERDCVDILIQLAATRAAIESVGAQVLRNYTEICMQKEEGNKGENLANAVAMWMGGKSSRR